MHKERTYNPVTGRMSDCTPPKPRATVAPPRLAPAPAPVPPVAPAKPHDPVADELDARLGARWRAERLEIAAVCAEARQLGIRELDTRVIVRSVRGDVTLGALYVMPGLCAPWRFAPHWPAVRDGSRLRPAPFHAPWSLAKRLREALDEVVRRKE